MTSGHSQLFEQVPFKLVWCDGIHLETYPKGWWLAINQTTWPRHGRIKEACHFCSSPHLLRLPQTTSSPDWCLKFWSWCCATAGKTPAAYTSKALTQTEQLYGQIEKEALSHLVWNTSISTLLEGTPLWRMTINPWSHKEATPLSPETAPKSPHENTQLWCWNCLAPRQGHTYCRHLVPTHKQRTTHMITKTRTSWLTEIKQKRLRDSFRRDGQKPSKMCQLLCCHTSTYMMNWPFKMA